MKKILALVLVALVASTAMATEKTKAPTKKEAPAKKEVKHHKKFDGTEVAGTKPDTPAKKK